MTKEQINVKWKDLESALIPYTDKPSETVNHIKKLYDIYESSCLEWLGGLYDSSFGGFYYSNSARDGEEFSPDIESTGQAIAILRVSGAISEYDDIPKWMRYNIAGFICSCEDAESGFFYNPQWSKEQTDKELSRRARDVSWAVELSRMFEFEMPYFTIFSNIENGKCVPEHLKNKDNYKAFLDSFDWKTNIYRSMSEIANQYGQIISAGLGNYTIKFFESLRDKESDLWGINCKNTDHQLQVVCSIVRLYYEMNIPVPEPMKIFEFILDRFGDAAPETISPICSKFTCINLLVYNLVKNGGDEYARTVRDIVSKFVNELPFIISATVEHLNRFKKPDSSFSYYENYSAPESHNMPVAKKNSYEGDVNATLLAVSIVDKLMGIITLFNMRVPIFSNDDINTFEEASKQDK